jgi:phage major head subunit gpT-like protein
MGANGLSSRAIIGALFASVEQAARSSWVPSIAKAFRTDQESETYKWLGMVAQMREWVGPRIAKGLRENGITVANKLFESTLEVDVRELRRDKTGQIMARIDDLGRRTVQHWAKLLSDLINAGGATACYDGQFFFDTDHADPGAAYTTAQSNAISVDISALPVPQHGSTTAPSAGEMSHVIMQAVRAILGFKDDTGEPINDGVMDFMVMAPISLWNVAAAALSSDKLEEGSVNVTKGAGLNFALVPNSRLTATEGIYVFRTGGPVTPLLRQMEVPNRGGTVAPDSDSEADIIVSAIAEGSEEEFKNHRHLYGVEASRNVGYAYWQYAVQATMI